MSYFYEPYNGFQKRSEFFQSNMSQNMHNFMSPFVTSKPQVNVKEAFEVSVDVQQFAPHELSVKVTDENVVTVEGTPTHYHAGNKTNPPSFQANTARKETSTAQYPDTSCANTTYRKATTPPKSNPASRRTASSPSSSASSWRRNATSPFPSSKPSSRRKRRSNLNRRRRRWTSTRTTRRWWTSRKSRTRPGLWRRSSGNRTNGWSGCRWNRRRRGMPKPTATKLLFNMCICVVKISIRSSMLCI